MQNVNSNGCNFESLLKKQFINDSTQQKLQKIDQQKEKEKLKNFECGDNEKNKKKKNLTTFNTKKSSSGGWGFCTDKKKLLFEMNNLGYHLGKRIGEGSYSKVYYAEHLSGKSFSNKPIACKIIDGRKTSTEYYLKFLPRELKIIQKITHPHIITVHAILEMGPFVCFFMDYCPYGDLLERIRLRGALLEKKCRLYFTQIISALHYLHSKEISHRDLKCENILIQNRYCVKLTDFGFARKLLRNNGNRLFSETFCGSAAYAAPEVLKGIPYNPKLYDMWSLGCILYIMMTGSMPYDDENITATIQKQEKHEIDYPNDLKINQEIVNLISDLLEPEVSKRITINEIINHPWLIL